MITGNGGLLHCREGSSRSLNTQKESRVSYENPAFLTSSMGDLHLEGGGEGDILPRHPELQDWRRRSQSCNMKVDVRGANPRTMALATARFRSMSDFPIEVGTSEEVTCERLSPLGGAETSNDLHWDEDVDMENSRGTLVSVFTIWNTMLGTSILAMPWAIQQAGFALGFVLILSLCAICAYSAILVVNSTKDIAMMQGLTCYRHLDFTDVCRFYFGRIGGYSSLAVSIITLAGALVVYYVLLCNFLFYTGDFIYKKVNNISTSDFIGYIYNESYDDIICHKLPLIPISPLPHFLHAIPARLSNSSTENLYFTLWSKTRTVPCWLLLLILPLISIKSPAFFAKFSAFGTVCVAYLFGLVFYKVSCWGLHFDTSATDPFHSIHQARPSFFSLTGVCSLAFFLHNSLHAILRNQREPDKNTKVILMAFSCVGLTYIVVGVATFVSFPLTKSCIEDNFLNNLATDIPVFIGRLTLFLQMTTVFPLLVYVLRVQVMHALFSNIYPSFLHVGTLNVVLMGCCLTFAMLVPQIGTIIRYTGAFCGMFFMFVVPPLIYILSTRQKAKSTMNRNYPTFEQAEFSSNFSGHSADELLSKDKNLPQMSSTRRRIRWSLLILLQITIMTLGVVNFLGQFFVSLLSED